MGRLAALEASLVLALGLAACAPPRPSAPEVAVPFHVIAHRGASGLAPENTLPAFEMALELGAGEIETDVQLSRDGVLVLFHDPALETKTPLRGSVREHDAEVLLRTDIGAWFDTARPNPQRRFAGTPLASLDQLFALLGTRADYHIEIKAEAAEIPSLLLAAIESQGLREHVTLTSFRVEQLERVRALDADVPICWLLRDPKPGLLGLSASARTDLVASQLERAERARDLGFQQIGIRASALSPELVQAGRALGLEVRAWGVKSDADMEHAIAAGANGMTIDWPDRLLARLREIESASGGAP